MPMHTYFMRLYNIIIRELGKREGCPRGLPEFGLEANVEG